MPLTFLDHLHRGVLVIEHFVSAPNLMTARPTNGSGARRVNLHANPDHRSFQAIEFLVFLVRVIRPKRRSITHPTNMEPNNLGGSYGFAHRLIRRSTTATRARSCGLTPQRSEKRHLDGRITARRTEPPIFRRRVEGVAQIFHEFVDVSQQRQGDGLAMFGGDDDDIFGPVRLAL
jgi:hypothetical protein